VECDCGKETFTILATDKKKNFGLRKNKKHLNRLEMHVMQIDTVQALSRKVDIFGHFYYL